MHDYRETSREVGRIIEANGKLPDSYYWGYLRDTYATAQAIAIRRQGDTSQRVVSLARLLSEISADAKRIARDFFVGMFQPDTRRLGERGFDEHFAGSVGTHLDPAIPSGDLHALTDTAAAVTRYVNQHLAHSDARASPDLPTFNDLDAAVDQIGYLFKKYANLLTASSYGTLVPVAQHDWKAIFRQPWIRP